MCVFSPPWALALSPSQHWHPFLYIPPTYHSISFKAGIHYNKTTIFLEVCFTHYEQSNLYSCSSASQMMIVELFSRSSPPSMTPPRCESGVIRNSIMLVFFHDCAVVTCARCARLRSFDTWLWKVIWQKTAKVSICKNNIYKKAPANLLWAWSNSIAASPDNSSCTTAFRCHVSLHVQTPSRWNPCWDVNG